ncbi:MAG: NAD-dependent DNA ligase LigA, partial [Duncaniella sp.]|nr:NAD-dependent DNA ligase LigA [Duncaniella sp.]
PEQIIGRIRHFVGRHAMDIDGVGEEISATLFATGLVRNIADFYDLTAERLMQVAELGPRTAERIMEGVEKSRGVTFDRVVYSLSIPFCGETVSRKLARSVGDIDRLMGMTEAKLTAIEDVGPRIAAAVVEYFALEINRNIIARLRSAGLQMAMPDSDD